MTTAFLLATLASLVAYFATGTLVLRALRLPWCWAIAAAPPLSLCVQSVLGEVFYLFGVPATPVTVLLVPIVVLAVVCLLTRKVGPIALDLPYLSIGRVISALVIGLAFGVFVFVRQLPSLDAVFQAADITKHATQIQAFVDGCSFSSLHSSVYLSQADVAIDPAASSSFYPCAWHIVCALACQMTGCGVPIAMNAANFVAASVVYPLGATAMLFAILGGDEGMGFPGALASVLFVSFPWALLVFGPLFPNLCAVACVPAIIATFILLTRRGDKAAARARFAIAFVLAGLGIAFTHPNAIFSSAVVLIPYCAHTIRTRIGDAGSKGRRVSGVAAEVVFLILCACIWVFLRYSPAFASVTAQNWDSYASPWQGLVNVLTLSFTSKFRYLHFVSQPVLAVILLAGARQALKDERCSWVVWSYVFAGVICVVCMSTEGFLKHLLGGFWYTDPYRLAATAIVAAMPLAALGIKWAIDTLARFLGDFVNKAIDAEGTGVATRSALRVAAYVLMTLLVIMPSFTLHGVAEVQTAFTNLREDVELVYGAEKPYSSAERAFVEQVNEVVPSTELVINVPIDGSILAYGFDDLRCYYRSRYGYGMEEETPESRAIREGLCDISTDMDVQAAVETIGAEYVLILDASPSESGFLDWYLDAEDFEGISAIDDDTPGFEVVLAEGDFRLYRIVA